MSTCTFGVRWLGPHEQNGCIDGPSVPWRYARPSRRVGCRALEGPTC